MKSYIRVVHEEGKATQEFDLIHVDTFTLDKATYTLYESKNFFGHPVTLAIEHLKGEDSNGRSHYQITVKAAVCSKEDTYKPEIGRALAVGRLMLSELEGLQLTNIDDEDEEYLEIVKGYIYGKATLLKDYLLTKDSMLELHAMSRKVGLQKLSEEFERFK